MTCCLVLDGLIKETTYNVMVDHLQSHVMPWHQYASHVKIHDTSSKMDVSIQCQMYPTQLKKELITLISKSKSAYALLLDKVQDKAFALLLIKRWYCFWDTC